jgi:predicted nucleic acid-binding protein
VILVDTSVWIDHLHLSDPHLVELLDRGEVIAHPMVVGELALGGLRNRAPVLDALAGLPSLDVALHSEVMHFVNERHLHGQGLSLVDAHLLASTILTPGTSLWTRDKRLREVSREAGLAYE